MQFTIALFSAISLGAAVPVPPVTYHATLTMSMPYYGLVEDLEVWFDGAAGLERIDYYGGLDTYLYNTTGFDFQSPVAAANLRKWHQSSHEQCDAESQE